MSIQQDNLTAIANAIRSKDGTTEPIKATDFSDRILAIPSGGGSAVIGDVPKVRYIDHKGVFAEFATADFKVSDIPSPPDYTADNLTFQRYNIDMSAIQIDPDKSYNVGASYITTDGHTYIEFVNSPATGYQFQIRLVATLKTGTVTMFFDDGESISVTNSTSPTLYTKNYIDDGLYKVRTVRIERTGDAEYYVNSESSSSPGFGTTTLAKKIVSCRFGSGVTLVGSNAFYSCYSLISVSIPEGVRSIGTNAFHSCYNLSSVSIPYGVTSIGIETFYNCYNLISVSIPESVTSIGIETFYNCYNLISVSIPEGVRSIASKAFQYCHSLISVSIPESVTSIGDYSFYNCYNLISVSIPEGVRSIGTNAFSNCYNLISVSIPESVTSIGSAFGNCYSLTKYTINAVVPPVLSSSITFGNINPTARIFVPDESLAAYKTATNWSTYANYIYPISKIND